MKTYYIYIMASKKNGTLYIGVTNDLIRRVWQHKNDVYDGFTKKYGVHRLVWYAATADIQGAIQREKQMKKWQMKFMGEDTILLPANYKQQEMVVLYLCHPTAHS